NASGGALAQGNLLEANGLFRAAEVVSQIRGEAGRRQVKSPHRGVAQSWRGVPTASGVVAVLSAK
ncbi:MAG: hypothetical protein O7H41_04230, partial [Planctomycetota bacterium]|nr:hypothetical protein [Planctomycetota bacterium]